MTTYNANFAQNTTENAMELQEMRELAYYYDNLCLHCVDNDIDLESISDGDFMSMAANMEMYGSEPTATGVFFFWIDIKAGA